MAWKLEKKIAVHVVKPGDALWEDCLRTEYQVFVDSQYIPENPQKRLVDYDRYTHVEFLCATVGDEIAGTMRIIYAPDHSKMKSGLFPTVDAHEKLRFFPGKLDDCMAMDPRQCIDIAAMVTVPKFRRNAKASKSIITRVMTRVWGQHPLRYAFAAIDTPFYEKLKRRDLPWLDLSESAMYWGSMTTAGVIDSFKIPKGWQKMVIPFFRTKGWITSG